MNITITPHRLEGAITPPPSKSQAHRLLIAAALSDGRSVLTGLGDSQDITATRRCLSALGAGIEDLWENAVRVHGLGASLVQAGPVPLLDCGESGSTLRFLIPVALLVNGAAALTGHGRLMERPLQPYEDLFREKGVAWEIRNGVLRLDGGRGCDRLALDPGEYRLPGNVSSQFFTGLLFALPLLDGDSTLIPTTPLESRDYLELTRQAQALAGVRSQWRGDALLIPGGQRYQPFTASVEADWSQAAFWYAAGGVGNAVTVTGMAADSRQGDRVILDYGRRLMESGSDVTLDMSGCPDLLPPLAAWAALRGGGVTVLANAGRLRLKESDRLKSVTAVLRALGADVTETPDSLVIRGRESLPGGAETDCWGDHRIAMMAAIAATRCREPVTLSGAECVSKSYPGFWEDYRMLGGIIHEHPGA